MRGLTLAVHAKKTSKSDRHHLFQKFNALQRPGIDATAIELYEYVCASIEARLKPSYPMLIQIGSALQSTEGSDARLCLAAHQKYVGEMKPIGDRAVASLMRTCTKLRDYETLTLALENGAYHQLFFRKGMEPLLETVDHLSSEGETEMLEKVHALVFPRLLTNPDNPNMLHEAVIRSLVNATEFEAAHRALKHLLAHKERVSGPILELAVTTAQQLIEREGQEAESGEQASDADGVDGVDSRVVDSPMDVATSLTLLAYADSRATAVDALGESMLLQLPESLRCALLDKDGSAPKRPDAAQSSVVTHERKPLGPNGLVRMVGGNPDGEPCRRFAAGKCSPFGKCSYSHVTLPS